jgi:hypothetical protein
MYTVSACVCVCVYVCVCVCVHTIYLHRTKSLFTAEWRESFGLLITSLKRDKLRQCSKSRYFVHNKWSVIRFWGPRKSVSWQCPALYLIGFETGSYLLKQTWEITRKASLRNEMGCQKKEVLLHFILRARQFVLQYIRLWEPQEDTNWGILICRLHCGFCTKCWAWGKSSSPALAGTGGIPKSSAPWTNCIATSVCPPAERKAALTWRWCSYVVRRGWIKVKVPVFRISGWQKPSQSAPLMVHLRVQGSIRDRVET